MQDLQAYSCKVLAPRSLFDKKGNSSFHSAETDCTNSLLANYSENKQSILKCRNCVCVIAEYCPTIGLNKNKALIH